MTEIFDAPMHISRRSLIKGAAGALALFTIDMTPFGRVGSALAAPDLVNGWIQINADNTVTVAFCAGELGQGIMTGLAQWAAEELMVDWSQVRAELVPPGRTLAASGNTDIGYGTGGSKGMVNRYAHMRKAGLEARLKLELASGGTAVGGGQLLVNGTNQPYSAFSAAAMGQTVTMPTEPSKTAPTSFPVPFVQPEAFKIVGKGTDVVRRLDIPDKVNGKAKYGLDVRIPGMVYAVVKNCPAWSGTLAPTKVPAAPAGTMKVVPLKPWVAIDGALGLNTAMALGPSFNAVAVVAANTWIAKKAASALSVSWTIPTTASKMTSSTMLTEAKALITSTTLTTVGTATTPPQLLTSEKVGDVSAAFAAAPVKVDQYYELPNIPHVMMEVPNATVRVNADGTAECWAPTQSPPNARTAVAKVLGIAPTSVTVYPQLCGGGLGRRIDTDVVAQAAQVAKALPVGTPVMLVWPREEDLGHDQPRPAVYARAKFGYDPTTGTLTSFDVRNVSQSPSFQRNPFKATNGVRTPSPDNVEGAKNSAYKRVVANTLVEHVLQNSDPMTSTPTGYWRSVGASTMCFVVESAIDELAKAAAIDPFTLRRNLLSQSSDPAEVRMVAVLDRAKSLIESQPLAAGSARGYAISEAFGSKAAVAVEVTKKSTDGTLQVKRVALAVDPGFVVNPDQVRAQMEGGIVHGISSALWGQLTWSSGKANTTNFSNARVLKMSETPAMQIDVLSTGNLADMGGTGEVPVPLMAPAMANAWFALTATRVRKMPFYPGARMSG